MLLLLGRAHAYKGHDPASEAYATKLIASAGNTASANTEEVKKPDTPPDRRQELESSNKKLDAKVDTLAAKFPESPKVQAASGEYWLSRGNLDKSVSSADRALELATPDGDPKLTSKALTIKGIAVFQKHDYAAAYKAGKTAHELDPDNRAAFEVMMYSESALRLRGMDELVAERVKRAVALTDPGVTTTPKEWVIRQHDHPTRAGMLSAKAIESREKGDVEGALKYAQAAVKADPSDPMAYFQRGVTRGELKDHAGAILDLSQAMAQGWTDPLLFKLRAEALLKAGRPEAAYHDAHLAVAYDPGFAAAYLARGLARLHAQRSDSDLVRAGPQILADLEKARRLDPSLGSFHAQAQEKIARAGKAAGRTAKNSDSKAQGGGAGPMMGSGGVFSRVRKPGLLWIGLTLAALLVVSALFLFRNKSA